MRRKKGRVLHVHHRLTVRRRCIKTLPPTSPRRADCSKAVPPPSTHYATHESIHESMMQPALKPSLHLLPLLTLFFHCSLSPLTLRHQASVVQHRCLRLVWSPSLPTLSSVYLHPHPLPPSPCCEKPPSCSADAAASAAAATRPSRTAGLPSTPETTLRLPLAPPAPKP